MADQATIERYIKFLVQNNSFVNNSMEKFDCKCHEGFCQAEIIVNKNETNPMGTVHGGCLFALADTAAGGAASTYGRMVSTVNADINFLRPATEQSYRLIATGRVIKNGKNIIVTEVSIKDKDDLELVVGTFSYMVLDMTLDEYIKKVQGECNED